MGIGDWGLGIGDLGLGPNPNTPSPIPNPPTPQKKLLIETRKNNYLNYIIFKKN